MGEHRQDVAGVGEGLAMACLRNDCALKQVRELRCGRPRDRILSAWSDSDLPRIGADEAAQAAC